MRTAELKIEDIAFGGKGVARENGKAVFIPYTIDSEVVTGEVIREKKKFAEAELVEVKQSSPHRVSATCPYFGRCGGCSYQHIDYPHQLAIKWRQVRDVLQRIGKLANIPMRPIIPSPLAYHYRNRITVHAEEGVIGFFRRDSHRLIDVECCPIAADEVNHALEELRKARPRDGHYTLRARSSGQRVFCQANDVVANALLELIAQLVAPGSGLLIDAYCGAGFFSKRLLDKFERVIGIDWDRFAIQAAREAAGPKETYIAADVEKELRFILAEAEKPTDEGRLAAPPRGDEKATLIVDPPATGLTPAVRDAISRSGLGTLIYVSCYPPTLARDLNELIGKFAVESVTPLDMFPQTAEIEVVAHLREFPLASG